jgi:hypothetical protein
MQTILKRKEETLPPGTQIGRYRLIKLFMMVICWEPLIL